MKQLHESSLLDVKPGPIKLRLIPSWHRHLQVQDSLTARLPASPVSDHRRGRLANVEAVHIAHAFMKSFRLNCPHCNHTRSVSGIAPRKQYVWAQLTCANSACHKKSTAQHWLCSCGCTWRSCGVHSKWHDHASTLLKHVTHRGISYRNIFKDRQVHPSRKRNIPIRGNPPAKRPRTYTPVHSLQLYNAVLMKTRASRPNSPISVPGIVHLLAWDSG
jgi:hypothetical protein